MVTELFWSDEDNWEKALKSASSRAPGLELVRDYLSNHPLKQVNRPALTGIRDGFDDIFRDTVDLDMLERHNKSWVNYEGKNTITLNSDIEVINYIRNTPGSVGYVRFSTYEIYKEDVSALIINDAEPTFTNIKIGKYPFQRKFRYFVNKEGVNETTQKFLDWLVTDEAEEVCRYDRLILDVVRKTKES